MTVAALAKSSTPWTVTREAARVYIAAGVAPELVAMAFLAGVVLDGDAEGGTGGVN